MILSNLIATQFTFGQKLTKKVEIPTSLLELSLFSTLFKISPNIQIIQNQVFHISEPII